MNRALQAVLASRTSSSECWILGSRRGPARPTSCAPGFQTDIAKWGEVIAKAGIEQQ